MSFSLDRLIQRASNACSVILVLSFDQGLICNFQYFIILVIHRIVCMQLMGLNDVLVDLGALLSLGGWFIDELNL